MKKVLSILVIMILLFSLSGCNSYRYNRFNENLEFDEQLSNEEFVEVIKNIVKKWADFSKMKIKANSNYISNSDKEEAEVKLIMKSYSNSLIDGNAITKVVNTKDGVKTKAKFTSEISYWDFKEGNSIIKRSTADGNTKYEASTYMPSTDNPFKYTYIEVLNELMEGITALNKTKAYKTNNGYVFIYSKRDESNDTYEDDSIRVKAKVEEQTIYFVNKEYEITKILYYFKNMSDRYMNDSLISSYESQNAMEIKISYGRKKDNLKLEEQLNKEYQEYKSEKLYNKGESE